MLDLCTSKYKLQNTLKFCHFSCIDKWLRLGHVLDLYTSTNGKLQTTFELLQTFKLCRGVDKSLRLGHALDLYTITYGKLQTTLELLQTFKLFHGVDKSLRFGPAFDLYTNKYDYWNYVTFTYVA